MKKILLMVVVIILFTFGFAHLSFAKQRCCFMSPGYYVQYIEGQIVSINLEKKWFMIKDRTTGARKRILADSTLLSSLTTGEKVMLLLDQYSGWIKRIIKM